MKLNKTQLGKLKKLVKELVAQGVPTGRIADRLRGFMSRTRVDELIKEAKQAIKAKKEA